MAIVLGNNMQTTQINALFSAMAVLAAIPSVSVLAVVTRSAAFGLMHGFCTSLGIVLGDILFILLALGGLALLATHLGGLFFLIKYLGAVYLIFLGVGLCRTKPKALTAERPAQSSLWSSFLTGVLITLADQKATLFYLGFLPAFVEVKNISPLDIAIVIGIAIVTVGGVKLLYALLASRVSRFVHPQGSQRLNFVAGMMMIGVGFFLVFQP
jgi:threonine/homoserine/homoserine lactone efflux protein